MLKLGVMTATAILGLGALAGCGTNQAENAGAPQDGAAPAASQGPSTDPYTAEELTAIISKVNGYDGPLKPIDNVADAQQKARSGLDRAKVDPQECRENFLTAMGGQGAGLQGIPTAMSGLSKNADKSAEAAMILQDGSEQSAKTARGNRDQWHRSSRAQ